MENNYGLERIVQEREIEIEKGDLFHKSLDETIKFLEKLKKKHGDKEDLTLEEIWCGYEDNYIALVYNETEPEEDFIERVKKKKQSIEKQKRQKRIAEENRKRKQREKDIQEFNRLKEKLGK